MRKVITFNLKYRHYFAYKIPHSFSILTLTTEETCVSLSQKKSFESEDVTPMMIVRNRQHTVMWVISLCCYICSSGGLPATNMYLHFLSRRFHASQILCWGTKPPTGSSTLFLQFFFFYFSDRPTQNLNMHSKKKEEKRGQPQQVEYVVVQFYPWFKLYFPLFLEW